MIMQRGEVVAVPDVPGCATAAFEGARLQPFRKGLKMACENRNKDPKLSPLHDPVVPLYWQQIPGAPHLARFSRDVGFHRSRP
jgi:hypothetical protein